MMKRLIMLMALALCLLALAFDAPPADATTVNVPCEAGIGNVGALIYAIEVANANGPGPDTIELAADCTYTLTSVYQGQDHFGIPTNYAYWYGPSGLPAIDSDITVEGNGATIERGCAGEDRLPAAVCRCRPDRPRHLWVRDPGGWQPDASGSNASGRVGPRWRCDRRWGRRRWHGRRYIQPGRGHAGAGG